MATKTISLSMEAYKKLRAAKRHPQESFSQVVLRARWPEETLTGSQLLARRETGAHFTEEDLRRIELLKRADGAPGDKWANR